MSTNDCIRCEFVEYMMESYGSWDRVASKLSNYPNNFVDVKPVDWFFDPCPENSWDGAHEQGHEGDVYMVFEYKGNFWRVVGTSDSYGACHWSHGVKQVFPTKVVKTVYEYSEVKPSE